MRQLQEVASASPRRAILGDAERIASFAKWSFCTTFDYIAYSEEDLQRHCDTKLSAAYFEAAIAAGEVWLATQADVCVGYCQLAALNLPVAKPLTPCREIVRLYIHPDWQGGGLADAFMRQMLFNCADEHVYLGVYSENTRAQRFYARYGFRKIGEYDYYVGSHIDREWILHRDSAYRQPSD